MTASLRLCDVVMEFNRWDRWPDRSDKTARALVARMDYLAAWADLLGFVPGEFLVPLMEQGSKTLIKT